MENVRKEVMSGTYFKGDESFNFNFNTDLSASDKASFVNSVVDTLISDKHYNSVLRDMIFDFMVVKVFTDVSTYEIEVNEDNKEDFDVIENIEQFLNDTNIVDIVKANAKEGLIEELNKAVDKSIEYLTGIHTNPLSEALASLVSTFEKKVNEIDLDSMMEMAQKFSGMTEELTPESVINAYINSDMHKENLVGITEAKKAKSKKSKKQKD